MDNDQDEMKDGEDEGAEDEGAEDEGEGESEGEGAEDAPPPREELPPTNDDDERAPPRGAWREHILKTEAKANRALNRLDRHELLLRTIAKALNRQGWGEGLASILEGDDDGEA